MKSYLHLPFLVNFTTMKFSGYTHQFVKFFTCLVITVFHGQAALAQSQNQADSLLTMLPEASDKQQVEIYLDLSDIYLNTDTKKAAEYAKEARDIADRINYKKGIGRALLTEGLLYQYDFELVKAKEKLEEALQHFIELENHFFVAKTYNNLGNNLLTSGQYEEALSYYEQALPLYEKVGNKKDASDCLGNMGLVHEYLGNLASALEFYLQSLAFAEASAYTIGIGYSYDCIGNIYGKLDHRDKSLAYQRKALAIFQSLNDKPSIAATYNNLGLNFKKLEQYDSALYFFNKSKNIFTETGNSRGIAFTLHNLGGTYVALNDQQQALSLFHQSIKVGVAAGVSGMLPKNYKPIAEIYYSSKQTDSAEWYAKEGLSMAKASRTKEAINQYHLLLSGIYEQKEQYGLALDHLRQHVAYQDSLFNEAKSRQVQELAVKYETQQKEQQIALQESMLANKSLIQKFLIVIVVLLIIASTAIFMIHRRRQTAKRRLVEEQLKNEKLEKERARELEQLKSRFYTNIAHEFRTPLTLILGPAQNIREQPGQLSAVIQNSKLIQKAAQSLLNLINQLLDLSKLEDRRLSLNLVQADFIPFIKGVVMSFESLALEKGIKLELTSEIDSVNASIDYDRTDKIFYNLLSNAFKFTEEGGHIAVNINYEAARGSQAPHIIIKVSDSGIGIPEDKLPLIFDRFFQVTASHDKYVEGTGIGLALAKELVELHQGRISVESHQQQGTTFAVYLPAIPTEIIPQEAGRAAVPSATPPPRIEKGTDEVQNTALNENIVLIIEDNADARSFIKACLGAEYQVLEAKNGSEGLDMAISHIPDLIISDVMMPVMNGYETCEAIRDNIITSHIPIIMLSAKAGLENRIEGLDIGVDDYLEKPFNRKELLVRIKNLIQTRKLLREKYASNNEFGGNPDDALPPKENQFIGMLREIIDAHLDDSSFGIEGLCKEAGVSRTQLHRKIKALTDLSTSRFVRLHKLQKAVLLLNDGHYNISEVSYMTGFSSPSYFSQCFHEEFGYAPSEQAMR